MKKGYRVERDFLGGKRVPAGAYYGIFTQRARENFQISGINVSEQFWKSLAIVKMATARANARLKILDKKIAEAIIRAAKEVEMGKFSDQLILDVCQAGAGTPMNMNINEVLANRANEILRKRQVVDSHQHVNMCQSSNDVIPTGLAIAILKNIPALIKNLKTLERSLLKKANNFSSYLKTGRTHLQDAVPVTLGQEFKAYASMINKSQAFILSSAEKLHELPLGGTAIGTGINAHPKFGRIAILELSKLTRLKLREGKDKLQLQRDLSRFYSFSAALACTAISIRQICNDLILLSSGPDAGLNEIQLPAVEPGSSIMPGKINPSIPESCIMACTLVMGNHHAVEIASSSGQLELNIYTPVLIHSILENIMLLKNAAWTLGEKCVSGIIADKKRLEKNLKHTTMYATALSPYIGYEKTAELIKEAQRKDISVEDLILRKRILTGKQVREILSLMKLVKPRKFWGFSR